MRTLVSTSYKKLFAHYILSQIMRSHITTCVSTTASDKIFLPRIASQFYTHYDKHKRINHFGNQNNLDEGACIKIFVAPNCLGCTQRPHHHRQLCNAAKQLLLSQCYKQISQFYLIYTDMTKTRNRLENGLVNGLEGTFLEMLFCNRNLLNHC